MAKLMRLFAVIAAAALAGCLAPKAYVDPGFAKVRYDDLPRTQEPLRLAVRVEFSRLGKRFPRADNEVRGHVERVLRASGLVVPSPTAADGEIFVAINNVGDISQAVTSGIATGLTFGLAGTTVTDGYEMSVTLNTNGRTTTKSGYKHALHTTIGNKDGPPGMTPTSITDGVSTIVEQMLLNALGDLRSDGYFGIAPPTARLHWPPLLRFETHVGLGLVTTKGAVNPSDFDVPIVTR